MQDTIDVATKPPILAIITGHLTPYRIAFHRRIVRELPEVRLATLVTRYRTGPWTNPDVPEIGTVRFDLTPPPSHEPDVPRGGRSPMAHLRHERGVGRRLVRWLDEHRPGAIICGGYDELPVLMALRWANRRGVPAFLWTDSNVHGDLATGLKRTIKNLYVPAVCRRYRGMLVCGQTGRRFFHRYGVRDERMFNMPVEPDYSLIENMLVDRRRELARSLGIDPDDGRKRLVCCCRLIPLKRVDLVIDAFRAIADERPEWDLMIVGSGESRAALEAQAGVLREAGRVRFLGFLDPEPVAAVYHASHALVLASDYEPWALVVNEAAAAGLAIVASDRVGAAYELVRDGVNGFMFPAGDLPALTAALRQVTDPARTGAMQAASRGELARWRREGDPIRGLREALQAGGVIGAAEHG